mmetsp:Transcript_36699/g.41989  ORF Transcript_36699/g.41989 Transcript_36699/m.41989 type:complete len:138 (-) Transcript_36699:214-627(-)
MEHRKRQRERTVLRCESSPDVPAQERLGTSFLCGDALHPGPRPTRGLVLEGASLGVAGGWYTTTRILPGSPLGGCPQTGHGGIRGADAIPAVVRQQWRMDPSDPGRTRGGNPADTVRDRGRRAVSINRYEAIRLGGP